MTRKWTIALLLVLIAFPGLSRSGDAAESKPRLLRVEVVNSKAAPVHLVALGSEEQASGETSPLRLAFSARNITGEFLGRQEMTATIYSEDGKVKGFHGFDLAMRLQPGEERFFLYRSDKYTLDPGDRVELSPADPAAQAAAAEPPAEEGPVDLCFNRCTVKETTCSTRCTCGVQEFSCSCAQGGAISYTCKCFMCN